MEILKNFYNGVSDFDLIYRLSDFCNFDYLNKYLASYRVHEKNESKKNNSTEINELNYIFRKIKKDKVFKNNNIVSKFSEKLLLKKFFLDKIKNNKSNLKIKETSFFIYRLVYLLIKFFFLPIGLVSANPKASKISLFDE